MSHPAALSPCEQCRREPASSFSWFADRTRWYADCSGAWKFTGACTADTESYYLMLHGRGRGWLDSAAARQEWLRHLREKRWFNEADFSGMVRRFEAAMRRARAAGHHSGSIHRRPICSLCGLGPSAERPLVHAACIEWVSV